MDDQVDGLFAQREVQFRQCMEPRLDYLIRRLNGRLKVEVDVSASGMVVRARAEQENSAPGPEVAFERFAKDRLLAWREAHGIRGKAGGVMHDNRAGEPWRSFVSRPVSCWRRGSCVMSVFFHPYDNPRHYPVWPFVREPRPSVVAQGFKIRLHARSMVSSLAPIVWK